MNRIGLGLMIFGCWAATLMLIKMFTGCVPNESEILMNLGTVASFVAGGGFAMLVWNWKRND
jgi:hypothetical protein